MCNVVILLGQELSLLSTSGTPTETKWKSVEKGPWLATQKKPTRAAFTERGIYEKSQQLASSFVWKQYFLANSEVAELQILL